MFTPEDLKIRPARPSEQSEVLHLISGVQQTEEQAEIRRQVKLMFLHPGLWVISGVLICVFGITFNIPPIPTSIVVLLLVFVVAKRRFQTYWNELKPIFNSKAADLQNIQEFYNESGEKRFFLVAEHRGRVAGTVALREAQGMPAIARTCKLFRMFVHPACRRMGIATKLIEASVQRAKKLGYMRMTLRTHATNTGGLRCYERSGFTRTGEFVFAKAFPLRFDTVEFEMQLEE